MKLVIVPNDLRDAINKKLDECYAAVPDAAADREAHYSMLLEYFDEHGVIPAFTVEKASNPPQPETLR